MKNELVSTIRTEQAIVLLLLLAVLNIFIGQYAEAMDGNKNFCSKTAKLARRACMHETKDDSIIGRANCLNLRDKEEREECYAETKEEREEAREECQDVYLARRDVCAAVGEARFNPDFSQENFVDPDDIGGSVTANPFFPLIVGHTWVYEGNGETITVVVTNKTKLINGVVCRVVTDIVEEDGDPVEVTDDWYAQDLDGNVWYCGEISQNYELFDGDIPEDAELVDIEGSWKAGRDHAQPGITMFFDPQPGTTYRQEIFLGDAEDVAEVLSVTGTESTPGGNCSGTCLVTRDFTPLDPGVDEFKYYAPGIGQILEIDAEGNRIELTSFTP